MKQIIKWRNQSRHSYLFGTSLLFQNQRVFFDNNLMPPGTVINEWFSQLNYQANRANPELPLLKRGKRYSIELRAQSVPVNRLYMNVSFKNRFGSEVDSIVLKNGEGEFIFPELAYSYSIQLMSGGCHSFDFDYFIINSSESFDIGISNRENQKILYPTESSILNVIFLESIVSHIDQEHINIFQKLGNVILLEDSHNMENAYVAESTVDAIVSNIKELSFSEVNFIGYGPVGNLAAVQYTREILNSKAYITTNIESKDYYESIFSRYNIVTKCSVASLLGMIDYSQNIISYAEEPQNNELELFRNIYQQLGKLEKLPIIERGEI